MLRRQCGLVHSLRGAELIKKTARTDDDIGMQDQFTPAPARRIAFIGFSDSHLAGRVRDAENILNALSFAPSRSTGHFYSGPRTNRVPTNASYLEFASADVAGDVFAQLGGEIFSQFGPFRPRYSHDKDAIESSKRLVFAESW
eukprot:6588926-Pyramimonas_sp.AAC.1